MAHAYHEDRRRYFEHQRRVTADHVIPFIEACGPLPPRSRVLEIGCGEAGVLEAFLQRGATAVGVDRNPKRLARGREYLAAAIAEQRVTLLERDAHSLAESAELAGSFDLIVLKDVIEHVEDRPSLLALLARLLRPGGRVFFSFPPWQMPFGGHQQVCRSWLLSRMPYFHLLPSPTYRRVLEAFGEKPTRVESLLATKSTGLATAELEALLERTGYRVLASRLFLINPMYSYRFGLAPAEQLACVARRAWRDFLTTCAYYVAQPAPRARGVPLPGSEPPLP